MYMIKISFTSIDFNNVGKVMWTSTACRDRKKNPLIQESS